MEFERKSYESLSDCLGNTQENLLKKSVATVGV